MAYTLTLTDSDIDTIAFVGGRYCWSESLRHLVEGENHITEAEAWEIQDAFLADTIGGHSYFPMLNQHSDLAQKLYNFMEAIV